MLRRRCKEIGERGQAVLRAVVKIALQPPSLCVGRLDDTGSRACEPSCIRFSLRDQRRETKSGDRRGSDVELDREHALGDRMEVEGSAVVHGVPESRRDRDDDRERRSSRSEPKRRPEQHPEYEVQIGTSGSESEHAQHCDCG